MSAVEPAATRAVSPAAAPTALPVVGAHRLRRIALAVGAVFAVLFVVGVVPRLLLRQRLRTDADAVRTRPPIVTTVNPRRAPEVVEIPLPGSIEAILETGIWARTDGYLRRRFAQSAFVTRVGRLPDAVISPRMPSATRASINEAARA